MKSVRVIVSGQVQGVFFRAFCKERADLLGLKGYVKNIDDDVELVLECPSENIEKMLELVKQGPPGSEISNVKYKNQKTAGFKDFKILL